MSKRAEEAALKAYPVEPFGPQNIIQEDCSRNAYYKGYEQAERDTIERACEWIGSLDDGDRIVDVNAFVSAFRNEMEEDI